MLYLANRGRCSAQDIKKQDIDRTIVNSRTLSYSRGVVLLIKVPNQAGGRQGSAR